MSHFGLKGKDGSLYHLKGNIIRLGRASDNAIVVSDTSISRYHINFYIKNGQLLAEDAGSSNGFSVNGQFFKEAVALKAGDTIAVGNKEFLIFDPSKPMPKAPSPKPTRPMNFSTQAPRAHIATASVGASAGASAGANSPNQKRLLVYSFATAAVLGVLIFAREGEVASGPTNRSPAGVPHSIAPLSSENFHTYQRIPRTSDEVRAEARFRESLRDFYNGNYSRAMIGFKDTLGVMSTHEGANDYSIKAEVELQGQLNDLIEDSKRSLSILQFQRAKGQALRVLSIVSEQIPQYSRKIASEVHTANPGDPIPSQEDILLGVPCESARKYQSECKEAIQLLKQSRKLLGEEESLKQ
jgi:hypothetical protein